MPASIRSNIRRRVGGPTGRRGRRPVRRGQRGLVLRKPGRHRGRPAARAAGRRARRDGRGPGPAGPGRGGPGPAGLPALRGRLLGPPVGRPGRAGGPGPATVVGLHLDQEPGLPRPALRGPADRPGHREHHARPDPRGVRGPRHRGPHGRRRPGRGGPGARRPGGRRDRHGRRGPGARRRGGGRLRQVVRRADPGPLGQGGRVGRGRRAEMTVDSTDYDALLTPPASTPPLVMVIFGASGDLTSRKILPALANLADRGRLERELHRDRGGPQQLVRRPFPRRGPPGRAGGRRDVAPAGRALPLHLG